MEKELENKLREAFAKIVDEIHPTYDELFDALGNINISEYVNEE